MLMIHKHGLLIKDGESSIMKFPLEIDYSAEIKTRTVINLSTSEILKRFSPWTNYNVNWAFQ